MGDISNGIRRLRFDHDEMTQQELSQLAGCTRQTIIALEAGKYTPSLALAFKLARAFNRRIEDVFQYAVPVSPEAETPQAPGDPSQ